MKIVIMDKLTTSSTGDIDFRAFYQLGVVEEYDNIYDDVPQILAVAQGADALVINKVRLTQQVIEQLPDSVKIIAISATGYDNIDIAAATRRGIKVANVPGYGTNAVAQLVIHLMLSCATQFTQQLAYMRSSGWDKLAGLAIPMHELAGKTIGVVGMGAIGQKITQLAQAFDMQVVAYNRTQHPINGVEYLSLLELAQRSDFVSLSCALNDTTRYMINSQFFAHMKPSAYLINTARGGLVDEDALIQALERKQLAGAGLDVLLNEPPRADNPLLSMSNVILTPHIGWAPIEARQRCLDITCTNIAQFMNGHAQNLVN
ncbi:MAG: D-2-hydroxyacid dehydrogenase [Proteobacteria bacterium]|nr:MAG: D-2-hydroxyacid dehydrogenase [Pseudomonadota bacterium]